MEISAGVIVAFLAMLIALVGALINLNKWFRERREENARLRDNATRAEAERDSIAVKGAEGALLVMERMLNLATQSEDKLRCKVMDLESEVDTYKRKLRQLENDNEDLRDKVRNLEVTNTLQAQKIEELARRLSNVERGES